MTYEEFADARLGALLRYAVMLTGDPHQAQDLVRETLVRVQLNWRRVARTDAPERYVRRMLANQFIDWRRGSWARRVLLRGGRIGARAGRPRPVRGGPGPDPGLAPPCGDRAPGQR
ncbi:sigma factor [Micromonospora aurantiaca (nom. illeg.)]|uniref:sigma factor n=1 Tax=Micromonospora aurantiaca (nom. illeg.) TaxID=47850 RepID=UPI0033E1264F